MLWILGILYVVLCFVLQTILFRKTEKKVLHFLPLILIGVIYIVCVSLPMMDAVMTELGRNDGFNFYGFSAMIAAGVNTVGLIAVGAAWIYESV